MHHLSEVKEPSEDASLGTVRIIVIASEIFYNRHCTIIDNSNLAFSILDDCVN